jgi:sulfide dehydrogenase cytochrome subunit
MKRIRCGGAAAIAATAWMLSACQTPPPVTTTPAAATAESPPAEKQTITPETARNLAGNCFTCHGPSGRNPGTIPSIATLSASEMTAKLMRFKRGDTFSTVMTRQAKGYTDAEIEAISNYLAGSRK